MPNLWLPNMEEEANSCSSPDIETVLQYVHKVHSRHLLSMLSEDVIALQYPVDEDYIRYCCNLNNSKIENIVYISPGNGKSLSYSQSLLNDSNALFALQDKVKMQSFVAQPYVQTENIEKLTKMIEVQWEGTDVKTIRNGVINRVNSKVFMKKFASSVGLTVAPGITAQNLLEIRDAVVRISEQFGSRVFLRKEGMTGGMGNLSGDVGLIKDRLGGWYHGGPVLVETFLPIRASLGSLLEIKEGEVLFHGVNKQLFQKGRWVGFSFPYEDERYIKRVLQLSDVIAKKLSKLGLRGWFNCDFSILSEDVPRAKLSRGDLIFNECNFRYTAVHRIWQFAKNYFKNNFNIVKINAYDEFLLLQEDVTFAQFYNKLKTVFVNKSPLLLNHKGAQSGVVITRPPLDGICGIAIFGFSQQEVEKYFSVLKTFAKYKGES